MDLPLDMDSPYDLAKQALAATGGRSTLKATEWILNRRAEAHHLASRSFLLHPQRASFATAAPLAASFDGEAAHQKGSHFPAARASFLGSPSHGEAAPLAEKPGLALDQQRHAALRHAPDCHGSSHFERPASTGSCSRPSESREEQFPLKILKQISVSELPESLPSCHTKVPGSTNMVTGADYLKHSHFLESGESPQMPKTSHQLPSFQNVSCKRQRQQVPDANEVQSTLSLAERMRPSSIDEILGQDLLGPELSALLDAECLPCIILCGPPGTGKTSLGKLLARPASCKVVSLSCTDKIETEIQDLLAEAKQAQQLEMRTILFLESLRRFSTSQQQLVLSAIEAGCVGLIGTTLNNPSSELISGLLSKCQVITFQKLQPDDLMNVMEHAMLDKDRGILASLSAFPGVDSVAMEDDALRFLADGSNGDARLALDALEAAVILSVLKDCTSRLECDANSHINKEITVSAGKERSNRVSGKRVSTSGVLEHLKANFQFSQEEYVKPFKKIVGGQEVMNQNVSKEGGRQKLDGDKEGRFSESEVGKDCKDKDVGRKIVVPYSVREKPPAVIVTLAEVKEALMWAIENSGMNSENLMAAMLKSIRDGDGNASIYWLARVLEGGENPLIVARQLIIFASEDVGLADANALVQAVASYQACQLLGTPGCSLTLAQCVAYLSMAPKSTAVKDAILAVQNVLRFGRQESEFTPVHMWTAPDSNELAHLPPSLQGHVFLHWPDPQLVSSESLKAKGDK